MKKILVLSLIVCAIAFWSTVVFADPWSLPGLGVLSANTDAVFVVPEGE